MYKDEDTLINNMNVLLQPLDTSDINHIRDAMTKIYEWVLDNTIEREKLNTATTTLAATITWLFCESTFGPEEELDQRMVQLLTDYLLTPLMASTQTAILLGTLFGILFGSTIYARNNSIESALARAINEIGDDDDDQDL